MAERNGSRERILQKKSPSSLYPRKSIRRSVMRMWEGGRAWPNPTLFPPFSSFLPPLAAIDGGRGSVRNRSFMAKGQ